MAWLWVLFGVGAAAAGLAGISRLAGQAVEPVQELLSELGRRPLQAYAAGVFFAAFLQSSSLFCILLLGLLHNRRLGFRAAAAMMLGANLGTTSTAFLTALDPGWLPLLIFFVSAALDGFRYVARRTRNTGKSGSTFSPFTHLSLSMVLLYLGLETVSVGLGPMASSQHAQAWLLRLGTYPLGGYFMGTLLAGVLFSSSLVLALLQQLVEVGRLPMLAALHVLYGLNLGTTADVWFASRWLGPSARRLAWLHAGFNLGTGMMFLALESHLIVPEVWLSLPPSAALAWAHFGFNLVGGVLALPLIRLLTDSA